MQAMPLTMIFDEKKNMKMQLNKLAKVITIHWAHVIQKTWEKRIFRVAYVFLVTDQLILYSIAAFQKEIQRDYDEMEEVFPQLENSIRVRIRYFDDFIKKIWESWQFVIPCVGYDAWTYRPTGLKKHASDLEVETLLPFRKGKICNPFLPISAEAL